MPTNYKIIIPFTVLVTFISAFLVYFLTNYSIQPKYKAQDVEKSMEIPVKTTKTYLGEIKGIKFSFEYPKDLVILEDKYEIQIGEYIELQNNIISELDCRGDCPVKTGNAKKYQNNGLNWIEWSGYVGQVGGNVPQNFIRYELETPSKKYLVFTLYELSNDIYKNPSKYPELYSDTPLRDRQPVSEENIKIMEDIVKSFKFID